MCNKKHASLPISKYDYVYFQNMITQLNSLSHTSQEILASHPSFIWHNMLFFSSALMSFILLYLKSILLSACSELYYICQYIHSRERVRQLYQRSLAVSQVWSFFCYFIDFYLPSMILIKILWCSPTAIHVTNQLIILNY